jgi:hypothetical protein
MDGEGWIGSIFGTVEDNRKFLLTQKENLHQPCFSVVGSNL